MRTFLPLTLMLALALAVAGCSSDSTDSGAADDGATTELAGVEWEWQVTNMMDDSQVTPDDPTMYTAMFNDDLTVNVKADCNSGSGGYETDGSSLSIGPLAVTMAMCPPESKSDDFLRQLQSAASYIIEEGTLHIAMAVDSGIMELTPVE